MDEYWWVIRSHALKVAAYSLTIGCFSTFSPYPEKYNLCQTVRSVQGSPCICLSIKCFHFIDKMFIEDFEKFRIKNTWMVPNSNLPVITRHSIISGKNCMLLSLMQYNSSKLSDISQKLYMINSEPTCFTSWATRFSFLFTSDRINFNLTTG